MQADQAGPAPVLIRIQTKAGHGAGKPISKIIEETADEWGFTAKNLGMEVEQEFSEIDSKPRVGSRSR